jgi:hypothetical protein
VTNADFENRLRTLLRQHENTDPPRSGLADLAVEKGNRVRRLRVWSVATVSSVAMVAVVSLAVGLHGRGAGATNSADPTSSATGLTGPRVASNTPIDAFDWLRSLPKYPDPPTFAYLAGSHLSQPGGDTTLKNASAATLIGESKAGAVVNMVQGDLGGQFTAGFFLITPNGDTSLLADSKVVTAQGSLVSPDGSDFTNGARVLDITSGRRVAAIPDDARYLIAWTDAGITYENADGNFVVWDPTTGNSVNLSSNPGEFLPGSSFGLRQVAGCSHVVELAVPGKRDETVFTSCEEKLVTVSPDGRYALTDKLEVVDLSDGSLTKLTNQSIELPKATHFQWGSDDLVALAVPSAENHSGIIDNDTTQSSLGVCGVEPGSCALVTVANIPTAQRSIDLGGQDS